MINYKKSNLLLLKRFLLVVLIYQLCRVLFFFMNLNSFGSFSFETFIGGLLFDFSAVAYLNIIFIIAHLIPGNFKYKNTYQNRLKIAFFSVNLLFIATNFIDIIYFRFTGRRSTFSLITAKGMEHEAIGLIPSFLTEFWYIGLLFLVFGFLFWKLLPNFKLKSTIEKLTKKDFAKQFSILLFAIAVCLLVARGGFQKKPIKIVDAAGYGELGNSALILNTPFCILMTIAKKEDIEKTHYFEEKELLSICNPTIKLNPNKPKTKKNVVILILESFGDENVGRGCTPFLDSLISKSYYFKNV